MRSIWKKVPGFPDYSINQSGMIKKDRHQGVCNLYLKPVWINNSRSTVPNIGYYLKRDGRTRRVILKKILKQVFPSKKIKLNQQLFDKLNKYASGKRGKYKRTSIRIKDPSTKQIKLSKKDSILREEHFMNLVVDL
jgi:hypothetical protein